MLDGGAFVHQYLQDLTSLLIYRQWHLRAINIVLSQLTNWRQNSSGRWSHLTCWPLFSYLFHCKPYKAITFFKCYLSSDWILLRCSLGRFLLPSTFFQPMWTTESVWAIKSAMFAEMDHAYHGKFRLSGFGVVFVVQPPLYVWYKHIIHGSVNGTSLKRLKGRDRGCRCHVVGRM